MNVPPSVVELIRRKRDGGELSREELEWLISSYTRDEIPDYQLAAFLMAIIWRGLTDEEVVSLMQVMSQSGLQLRMRDRVYPVADKHSTGGVGDKVTLVVAPLAAACGLAIAKTSGRGLGHTGGTVDKLESIPGMRVEMGAEEFARLVERHGLALAAQSDDLAPADGKLYALRDVTATVDSIPLIAASIMSKKLAVGCSDLLLDVKIGRGAFTPDVEDARRLGSLMVRLGKDAGIRTTATITSMSQPLGWAIGNSLEVAEAVMTLKGQGPEDVTSLCVHEAGLLLRSAGLVETIEQGEERARGAIRSGAAVEKLAEVVAAQGGDAGVITGARQFPAAACVMVVAAPRSGFVAELAAERIGEAVGALGAGRTRKGDSIAPEVGMILRAKVGSRVERGEPLAEIHARTTADAERAAQRLLDACAWVDAPVEAPPLLLGEIN